jgi:lysozyme family protein
VITVDAILDGVLAEETRTYTDDPNDSGGPTKWGITLPQLSAAIGHTATVADMQALTRDQALSVLRYRFVAAPHFDRVLAISPSIGERLVDGGVLCGPSEMTKFLQRGLMVFNFGPRYPAVADNGVIDNTTLQGLRAYLAWRGSRGEALMVTCIECQLGAFFVADAEHRPKDEKFVFGWFDNRIRIPTHV